MDAVSPRRPTEYPSLPAIIAAAGSLVGAIFIARSGMGAVGKGFAMAATLALPIGITLYSTGCAIVAVQRHFQHQRMAGGLTHILTESGDRER